MTFSGLVAILVSKLQDWNWRNTILILTTLTKWRPRQYVTTIFNLCISICKRGLLTLESVLWMWSYMMFSHHWYAAYSVLTISLCGIHTSTVKVLKAKKNQLPSSFPMTYNTHLSGMHPTDKAVKKKGGGSMPWFSVDFS